MHLSSPIESIPRISAAYAKRLNRLGIKTVKDLLHHFPFRYDDLSKIVKIRDVKINEIVTVRGEIINIKTIRTFKKKMFLTEALIKDDSGTIRAVWYNQPFLTRTFKKGIWISLAGKANYDGKTLYFSNPANEKINPPDIGQSPDTRHTGKIVPVYPETAGLTSKWLRYILKLIAPQAMPDVKEFLPPEIKKSQNLIGLNEALKKIHFPEKQFDIDLARRRLGFDEIFLIQLFMLEQKYKREKQSSPEIKFASTLVKNFVSSLPFKLTNAQRRATWEILQDLEKPRPMNRLLEGDVGSGKTVVAAIAALETAKAGYQTAFMAPTEILAKQHFNEITKLLKDFNITIGLLTSADAIISFGELTAKTNVSKKEFIQNIKQGELQIIIGTHALIQDNIAYKNLSLVVVDEQHRFGVKQRQALLRGTNAELTQNHTETKINKKLLYEELTYKIRSALFDIKKELGSGHKEIVYQRAIVEAFDKYKIKFSRETRIPIFYNNKKVGTYVPDFIVENKIIIELKALPFVGAIEKKQIWNYLKGSKYHLALLVNYGPKELTINRFVYDPNRTSASVPHSSVFVPHLLSMTATPIPRTLTLTIYGDLDLSLLNEMPRGRKEILTKVVPPQSRQKAYDFIRQQIKNGRQAFVICPRIDPPQTNTELTRNNTEVPHRSVYVPHSSASLDVKTVTEEYKKLSEKIFPDLKIAMLHGKLKAKEKEKIMADFSAKGETSPGKGGKSGKTDILVSTSVVEVGIDIPNATVMMIEGSERFGLAQLYQFKGRVGRGEHQSYCFLFTDSSSQATGQRLKAIAAAKSSFELAEHDLAIRGPGEFYGTRQWGLPDLAMASLTDVKLIKQCREEAEKLLAKNPELDNYPLLKEKLKTFQENLHLE